MVRRVPSVAPMAWVPPAHTMAPDSASGKIAASVGAEILGVVDCVLDQAGDRAMIAWGGNDDAVCGAQCFDQRRRTLHAFDGVVVREIQRFARRKSAFSHRAARLPPRPGGAPSPRLIRRATFRRSRRRAETSLSSQRPAFRRSTITWGPRLLKRMRDNSDKRAHSPGIDQCHTRLSLPSAPHWQWRPS